MRRDLSKAPAVRQELLYGEILISHGDDVEVEPRLVDATERGVIEVSNIYPDDFGADLRADAADFHHAIAS